MERGFDFYVWLLIVSMLGCLGFHLRLGVFGVWICCSSLRFLLFGVVSFLFGFGVCIGYGWLL